MTRRPDAQLTHVGFYVRDMDVMADFYRRVMGMAVTDAGEAAGRAWTFMSRDPAEHHQIVLASGRPDDSFQLINQISFRLAGLDDLRTYYSQLSEEGVVGLEAVTHGNSWSVYFLDPEGNRVELYAKSHWYVAQPMRVAVDLSSEVEELIAENDALTANDPSRVPLADWQNEMRRRLDGSHELPNC